MNTFILYDDSLPNADGSRVQLRGLQLDRFQKNPVMLYMHNRADPHTCKPDGSEVIGRWENIRTEGRKLLADAVFDEKDPLAKKIARKVKEGFLKGASIGIDVHSTSDAASEKLPGQKGSSITESTLLEASVVDIPQNREALNHCALYQSFSLSNQSKTYRREDSILKSLREQLSLSEDTNEQGLLKAIERIVTEYKDLRSWKHNFLKQQSDEQVSIALKDGLILEEEKAKYKAYFYDDFVSTKKATSTVTRSISATEEERDRSSSIHAQSSSERASRCCRESPSLVSGRFRLSSDA